MEPLISIVVPVYKTERYLSRCVKSLQCQDYENIQIILVDDGSPDGSGALCDALALTDQRITVIHKANGGLSSARNAGIEQALGTYIAFVDSDDYVERDYLSTLYGLIKKNNVVLAKVDYEEVSINDYSAVDMEADAKVYRGNEVERAYLDLKVDSACVFLYNKNLIGESRFLEGRTSEDIPFNFEIFRKADSFAYLPSKKYYYYYNPESISNGPLDKNMINYLLFREEIFEYYRQRDDKYLLNKAEVLYARAVMGLMARMALYGISADMDEAQYKKLFKMSFMPHCKSFFADCDTPISRKVLAFMVFWCYGVVKMLRGIVK